jgi:putative DNA primase/helicase
VTEAQVIAAAQVWAEAGVSVIPVLGNGSKRPVFEWKRFQGERATPKALDFWITKNEGAGIGVVCGAVSGNLEMTELEADAALDIDSLDRIQTECDLRGVGHVWKGLWEDGYRELSPSGGMHFLYRIADYAVPGNTKLAHRPTTDEERLDKPNTKIKVLAETRGEGGYVVVAPSGGTVHETGYGWECLAGEIGSVPTISWADRCLIHEAITAALDIPVPEVVEFQPPAPSSQPRSGLAPGDDFNERAQWSDLLQGWTVERIAGGTTYWVKPGSNPADGHHATTGRVGPGAEDRLYVFSTATEFEAERPYNKFAAYTLMQHRGDFSAAARELSRLGFGERSTNGHKTAPAPMTWGRFEPGSPSSPPPQPAPMPGRPGRESFTDVGTANRFLRENPFRYIYVKQGRDNSEWRWFDGAIWRLDDTECLVADALETLVDQLDDESRAMLANPEQATMGKALAAYVKSARSNSGRKGLLATVAAKLAVSPKDLDHHAHLLGLANGVLNVRTGEVLAPDPKYLITKTLGAAYDPAADAPRTREYLTQVLPGADYRDYVQRGLGYTLTGEQNQRAFFILHGDPGTGKSQFLELFRQVFGDYSRAAADGAFRKKSGSNSGGPTAELHALQGARFVFASESDEDVVFDADVVKRICGGDTMSTRTLYQKNLVEWRAECVVWLATNHFPRFPADEEAVWDRVKAVPFDVLFPKTAGRQVSIADDLFAAEASGILNLLIGFLRDYRQRGLAEPECLVKGVAARQDEVNPVAQFWDEMVGSGEMVEEPGNQAEFQLVYTHFTNWYKNSWGQHPMGSRRFGRLLKKSVGYDELAKRHGKTYLPGWKKMGFRGVAGTMYG